MRAVIQRVRKADVIVGEELLASIGTGIVALIGIAEDDTENDMQYIIKKILGMRIFDDENGIMNLSISDVKGELLLVSQFTLLGDTRKGKRPSYSAAMQPAKAKPRYEQCVEFCKSLYPRVQSGEFGAEMKVSLVNWGPVTLLVDSKRSF